MPGVPPSGLRNNFSEGIAMFLGAAKGGRPIARRAFGFRWIDTVGAVFLPLGVIFIGIHAIVRKVRKP